MNRTPQSHVQYMIFSALMRSYRLRPTVYCHD